MILILGAGIIGLFTGYNLLKKGKKVIIFDANNTKANSTNAAVGMLAPLIEAKPQEFELFNLMLESKRIWKNLHNDRNIKNSFEYKKNGSLMIAQNEDDQEKLLFKKEFFKKIGFNSTFLDAKQTLDKEPFLNSNITSSLFCDNQDQINPDLLKKFLIKEIHEMGGVIKVGKKIKKILLKKNKVFLNNVDYKFEKIIISCGAWSNEIIYNSFGLKVPLRPLKGISLLVKSSEKLPIHNLWFRNIYIAPRSRGILAIGATEEEKGFDSSIKIDELYFLTNSIWESFPKLESLILKKIRVGLRPAIVDGNPIIGPMKKISPNIICNFGHYRNGILLAPITAEIVSKYVFEENVSGKYKFFSPSRFNL